MTQFTKRLFMLPVLALFVVLCVYGYGWAEPYEAPLGVTGSELMVGVEEEDGGFQIVGSTLDETGVEAYVICMEITEPSSGVFEAHYGVATTLDPDDVTYEMNAEEYGLIFRHEEGADLTCPIRIKNSTSQDIKQLYFSPVPAVDTTDQWPGAFFLSNFTVVSADHVVEETLSFLHTTDWKYGTYPLDEYEPNPDLNSNGKNMVIVIGTEDLQLVDDLGRIPSSMNIIKTKSEDYFRVGVTTITSDETVEDIEDHDFIWRYVTSADLADNEHFINLGAIFEDSEGSLVTVVENHGPNVYSLDFCTPDDVSERHPMVNLETELNVDPGDEMILAPGLVNGIVMNNLPGYSPLYGNHAVFTMSDWGTGGNPNSIHILYSLNDPAEYILDVYNEDNSEDMELDGTLYRYLDGSSHYFGDSLNGKTIIYDSDTFTGGFGGTIFTSDVYNDPLNCGLIKTYDRYMDLNSGRTIPNENEIELCLLMLELEIPEYELQAIAEGGEDAWNAYFDAAEENDIPFDIAFYNNDLGISLYKVEKQKSLTDIYNKRDLVSYMAEIDEGSHVTEVFRAAKYFDESIGTEGEDMIHLEFPLFIANGPYTDSEPARVKWLCAEDGMYYLVYFDGNTDDYFYDPFGVGTGPELKAPEADSPSNGETDVDYGDSQTISWTCDTPDESSTTYDVYVSTLESNVTEKVSSCRLADDTSENSITTSLDMSTVYYVGVEATCGEDTEYGQWSFTTRGEYFTFPPMTNPGPVEGAVNQPVETMKLTEPLDSLTLTWNQVSEGITGWEMFLAGSEAELELNETGDDFVGKEVQYLGILLAESEEEGTTEHVGFMTEVEKAPSESYLLYDTTYYWRLVAIAGEEHRPVIGASAIDYGAGPIWSFTTRPRTMDTTANTTDINSSQGMTTLWNLGTADLDDVESVTYDIYLSTTPGDLRDGQEPAIEPTETGLSTPTCSFGNLEPGTTYYWMVKSTVETQEVDPSGLSASGTEVFYSDVFTFTTAPLGDDDDDSDTPVSSGDGNCNVGAFPAAFGLLMLPLMFLMKK